MTFELPVIRLKIKIGYTIERMEQFIPNPLRCYKYQKFGHYQDKCNGRSVCGKCGQKDPDPSIEEGKTHTDVQTVVETTQYMQKHAKNGKKS